MPYTREHRFQNTLKDLLECQDHLDEPLSDEEKLARRRLMDVCREIAATAQVPLETKQRTGPALDRG